MISIAIILMTTLVIQQGKWNDNLAVSTQAYEMALMIRQAQINSLGVKEYQAGSGDKFNLGYGVYFDTTFTRYIYFVDKDRDKIYDDPGEKIEEKTFIRGVTIEKFCGNVGETCSGLNSINVSFFRPEPKATIIFNPSGGFSSPATIYLKSSGNIKYKIKVEANGQISITKA